jgi:hypothetical protein
LPDIVPPASGRNVPDKAAVLTFKVVPDICRLDPKESSAATLLVDEDPISDMVDVRLAIFARVIAPGDTVGRVATDPNKSPDN